jgi:type IV fimbrial biogenesis protein FimT
MLTLHPHRVSGIRASRRSEHGFSMIELLMTIAILAIMMYAALPAYTAWVQNTQIRTSAESIKNGLQLARAEAIQTNRMVRFNMTTGTGWRVNPADDPDKDPPIAEKLHAEGTGTSTGVFLTPPTSTEVVFDGFGKVVTPPDPIRRIRVATDESLLAEEDHRRLDIVISSSGNARMCDPKVTNLTDTRVCPP